MAIKLVKVGDQYIPSLQKPTGNKAHPFTSCILSDIPEANRFLTDDARNYLEGRGIASGFAESLGVFSAVQYAQSVEDENGQRIELPKSERNVQVITFPNGSESYAFRSTSTTRRLWGKRGEEQHLFAFSKVYSQGAPAVVFITEGEMDALTLLQNGVPCVSIGGVGGVRAFFAEHISTGQPLPPVIVNVMDTDEPGRVATEKLKEILTYNDYKGTLIDFWETLHAGDVITLDSVGFKDINALYNGDREKYKTRIQELRNEWRHACDRYNGATYVHSWTLMPPTSITWDMEDEQDRTAVQRYRMTSTATLNDDERRRFSPDDLKTAERNGVHLFERYLTRAHYTEHHRPTFICPHCGHGEHSGKGAAILTKDGGAVLYCSSCGQILTPIQLLQEREGLSFVEATKKLLKYI